MGYRKGVLPVTEDLSERLLRLPIYYELGEEEVGIVVDSIYSFFKQGPIHLASRSRQTTAYRPTGTPDV